MNCKTQLLEQYPSAKAVKSIVGYMLDGVHGVLKVNAVSEKLLWDEAWKCAQRWPDAHARYVLKVEHEKRRATRDSH